MEVVQNVFFSSFAQTQTVLNISLENTAPQSLNNNKRGKRTRPFALKAPHFLRNKAASQQIPALVGPRNSQIPERDKHSHGTPIPVYRICVAADAALQKQVWFPLFLFTVSQNVLRCTPRGSKVLWWHPSRVPEPCPPAYFPVPRDERRCGTVKVHPSSAYLSRSEDKFRISSIRGGFIFLVS